MSLKYKRILLKLSGESLAGASKQGIDATQLSDYACQIKELADLGTEIVIVVGGGNIYRGLRGAAEGVSRVKGDQMGMLATTINAIALASSLNSIGQKATLLTATPMPSFGEYYTVDRANQLLAEGHVVFVAGGTGNPYFTTDTASALRGIEMQADVMLKGTRVDGIYTADPEKDPTATKIDHITYDEIYRRNFSIMDLTATTMCKENDLTIVVFDMDHKGNLKRVMLGENIGTIVDNKE